MYMEIENSVGNEDKSPWKPTEQGILNGFSDVKKKMNSDNP